MWLTVAEAAAENQLEPKHVLISSTGSERATSGAGNKIVTFGGKTHVVWQDVSEKGYFNRVRSFDHASGKWSEPFTLNRGKDNHARPVITVDKQGFLHVILSGHNSPNSYRRSVKPNDATAWTESENVGLGTYPVIVCDKQGKLYLTVRNPNRWNGVDFYVKPAGQPWKAGQTRSEIAGLCGLSDWHGMGTAIQDPASGGGLL